MTKQELLTKLAMECATWKEAAGVAWSGIAGPDLLANITKQDWLAERERLLNKPDWARAPKWATHLALDESLAQWRWHFKEPILLKDWAEWVDSTRSTHASCAIDIPAGYDWKQSLEERPV